MNHVVGITFQSEVMDDRNTDSQSIFIWTLWMQHSTC